MLLDRVETFVTAPPTGIGGSFWVLTRVTTDDGVSGVGECYGIPFSGDLAASMVEDVFDRYIAGRAPTEIETMFRLVYSAGFTQRPDPTMMSVFSGIEMAVWDILGKAAGRPVYDLLGGRFHDRLRTYTYLYPESAHRDLGTAAPSEPEPDPYHDPEAAAERALHYVDLGFTAVKQDPTGPYTMQGGRELSRPELARSEANVRAIREAVGDRADILFGTHGQMATSSARRLAARLEPHDPLWFEEPCPPDQMEALAEVAASTSIPIAAGERLTTRVEFRQALDHGVRIVQPNVGRAGGIWEAKKIAVLAEAYNAHLAPHIYCGPIAHAAAAHVGFSSPNFLILETIQTAFHDAVVSTPLEWADGYLLAPSAPGLGVELNDEVVAAHPYTDRGGRLHLEMTQTPVPSDNTALTGDLA